MAFAGRAFIMPRGYGLWTYRTTDSTAQMTAAGYFSPAYDIFETGDRILVTTVTGDVSSAIAPWVSSTMLVVTAITAGGAVTVAEQAGGGSDGLGTDGDTGDITVGGSGTTLTIDNGAVTFAKIQDIATARILGRTTAGSGSIEELTAATVKTFLNLTGTNSGDVTLGAIGSTPNANGATLTGQVLNLEPASATLGGVVTAGTQTLGGDKTLTGTLTTVAVQPTADDTSALGTTSLRYSDIRGTRARIVKGAGTITQTLNGHVFGRVTQSGTGVATLAAICGSATASTFAFGAPYANGSGVATVSASVLNTFVFGRAVSVGATAEVVAAAEGSFVAGIAIDNGVDMAKVQAIGGADGSFVQGYASASDGAAVVAAGAYASFVQGFCSSGSASTINGNIFSGGAGGFAQGAVDGGGEVWVDTGANGGFAQGYVQDGGSIRVEGLGGFAHGYVAASPRQILASANGAFAVGYATGADIVASASNAAQFGPGTNALADSLQIGLAGLRLKGTTGAPGTPQNGDVYIGGTGNAFVTIHSNAKAVQINTGAAAWTVGAHATRRNFTATTTAAEALELLETLIEELQAANIIN